MEGVALGGKLVTLADFTLIKTLLKVGFDPGKERLGVEFCCERSGVVFGESSVLCEFIGLDAAKALCDVLL